MLWRPEAHTQKRCMQCSHTLHRSPQQMLQFGNLKLVRNRNASADDSPLSYSLQQGALRLVSFSDPEGQKGLPYCPSGRQRNKYLLPIIIFKGLAAADLLDLGEKELWGGEKAEFLWFPQWFSMLTPYPSKATRGACPVLGGHSGSLAMRCCPSPKRASSPAPGPANPLLLVAPRS